MSCQCVNVDFGTYIASVVRPIPPHMDDYRRRRAARGLSVSVAIDRCIVEEVESLWAKGIRTYGSCCGHNKNAGYIQVHDDDIPVMLAMGYVSDGIRDDAFVPRWRTAA